MIDPSQYGQPPAMAQHVPMPMQAPVAEEPPVDPMVALALMAALAKKPKRRRPANPHARKPRGLVGYRGGMMPSEAAVESMRSRKQGGRQLPYNTAGGYKGSRDMGQPGRGTRLRFTTWEDGSGHATPVRLRG